MSWIKRIKITNFLGIEEKELTAGKINILKGFSECGKTSFIDAIEKAYTNNNRRTKVIRTGEKEATLFIEQTDGLTIDRKVRTESSDYLNLKKDDIKIKSTETQLRKLLNGDIFRPLEWAKRSSKEQTKSILNMIKIDFTKDDIEGWFGEIPQDGSIVYNQHILQVLKEIEQYYFNARTEIKRNAKSKNSLMLEIKDELPESYNGDDWKNIDLMELYNKLNKINETNLKIEESNNFINNMQSQIDSITLKYKNETDRVNDEFDKTNEKFEKTFIEIENEIDENRKQFFKTSITEENILKENERTYQAKLVELKKEFEKENEDVKEKFREERLRLNKIVSMLKERTNNGIHTKEQYQLKRDNELKLIKQEEIHAKESLKQQLTEMKKLASNEKIDTSDLEFEIDKTKRNQSFIREWERSVEIAEEVEKLTAKALKLTEKIDFARELPTILLKKADLPIEGISINEKNEVLVNERPIDNMSTGEMNRFSMKIAKGQAGELKIVCLDGFHSLNKAIQDELIAEMEKESDEFQYFLTETTDDDFTIEVKGDI